MDIPILLPSEPRDVQYYSSVFQHRNKLAAWSGGEWKPIVFKQIIGIDCDHIITRDVILADRGDLGYDYKVGDCEYTSDTYVLANVQGEETDALQEWFGAGFYKKYRNEAAFVNFGNGSLGNRNIHKLRIGLNYAKAKESLPPID